MKRARIIYNPSSGREVMRRQLPYLLESLEDHGYEASAHATKKEGCAKDEALRAGQKGYDMVVAAGGDGTVFEVVNGLAPLANRPKLGVIPAGTSNDFARALGIPKSLDRATEVLYTGEAIPIDVGKVGDKYFINIAAAGSLTELTYDTPSRLKTVMGQLAYYIKGIEKLPTLSTTQVQINYDGASFEGEIILFLVANTNSVGGFEHLAPQASYQDGLFDLLIAKKMSIPEMVRLGHMLLHGEHLHHPKVLFAQTKSVKVDVETLMHINLDGEYGGMLPGKFENLHRHLSIITPKGSS